MGKISDRKLKEEPSSLLQFVKLMYFLGYLPIKWTKQINGEKRQFEISWPRTILVIILDFLMALIIPAYGWLWHWLNFDNFDLGRLLTVNYYLELNDGNVTTALCQLAYIAFPSSIFWVFGTVGKVFN